MYISPVRTAVISYSPTANANPTRIAQCPHGTSPGSCMVCTQMRMGGGGGGGAPKKTGMSWNEAYATWKALQVAKTRNEDYLAALRMGQAQQNKDAQVQPQRTIAGALASRIAASLTAFFANPPRALEPFMNAASKIGQLGSSLQQNVMAVRTAVVQTLIPIVQAAEKLTTILGDMRKMLDDALHHNLENLKSWLAQSRLGVLLQQVNGMMQHLMEQFGPQQLFANIDRRVRSILEKLWPWTDEEEEDDKEKQSGLLGVVFQKNPNQEEDNSKRDLKN